MKDKKVKPKYQILKSLLALFLITITQLLCWGAVIWADRLEETSPGTDYRFMVIMYLPAVITVLYLLLQIFLHKTAFEKLRHAWNVMILWAIEDALIIVPVFVLLLENNWFVYQRLDLSAHFLNGAEYLAFAFTNVFEPLIILTIWSVFVILYMIIKNLFFRKPKPAKKKTDPETKAA